MIWQSAICFRAFALAALALVVASAATVSSGRVELAVLARSERAQAH